MTLAVGLRLAGRYEVLSPLGAGGMGEVYRVRDVRLHRDVAVKVLPEHLAEDEDAVARLLREAQALASLQHPSILTIHDVHLEPPVSFVVTELLEGQSLGTRLRSGALTWREAFRVSHAVALALEAAHGRGVIHRDIKPDNIFLVAGGGVKLLDFGLARLSRQPLPEADGVATTVPAKTREGLVVGTIDYMSPEQLKSATIDQRADLWSFGAVLYEMLAGRRPFERPTSAEKVASILLDPPPPAEAESPDVPAEALRLALICLEKDPGSRFQSFRELLDVLEPLRPDPSSDVLPTRRMLANPAPAERAPSSAGQPLPEGGATRFLPALWALAAVLLVALVVALVVARKAPPPQRLGSVAVLPFVNESGDGDAEYLAEGIADSLLHALSSLPGLRVPSRSAVHREKEGAKDPVAAGRRLGVDAVLAGRVLVRGETLVVRAELTDVARGAELWGGQYDRPRADLLKVQESLAREIAERLAPRLSGEESARLAQRPTRDPVAYDTYLRGRWFFGKRNAENLRKAIDSYQAAIDRDPAFALAWAGLADAYDVLPFWGVSPPKEAFPKAKAAAQRALAIDPQRAEALASLAYAKAWFDWDLEGAEADFKRAIELRPEHVPAHHWYGVLLGVSRRFEEGRTELRKALELDPFTLIASADLGLVSYWEGKLDEAEAQVRRTLELDPVFVPASLYLGLVLEAKGDLPGALEALGRASELSGGSTVSLAALGHAEARSGRKREARKRLEELQKRASTSYVSAYLLAVLQLGLGQKEASIAGLQAAREARSEMLPWVLVDPRLQPLATDRRFQDLIRQAGLAKAPRSEAPAPAKPASTR